VIEKNLNELEAKIRAAEFSNAAQKNDLLQSLAQLKKQIAAREQQNLTPLKNSVEELRSSVEGFEQSHPKLVEVVNRISSALANLGI
jgi:malonyl CoA-acyl carrier protein transacylase